MKEKPNQNTISESVLDMQFREVAERAKTEVEKLRAANARIEGSFGEYLDGDYEPKGDSRNRVDIEKADDEDLALITREFEDRLEKVLEADIAE